MQMKEMLKNAIIDALNSHKWKGVSYDNKVYRRDRI